VTTNFTPTAGSLNRNTDGWANEPVLVSDGSNVYAGWIETGRPFDSANAGFPHPYVSQLSGGVWTNLGGSYLAIDSEFAGYDEAHAPSMSMVGGKPWISWYKTSNNGQLTPNSLYAKYWNGQAWVGGAVGAVKAVGANISGRSQLAAVGNTPYIGFEEIDRSCYPWCQNLFVKKWNGSVWSQVGSGPLNRSPYSAVSSPHADSVSLTSDGANPYVAWTEYSMSSSLQADSPPQVYVDKWNGSAWVSLGGSLNVNPSGYANDASIVYSNGQPYVAWTERTQSGNNQVYVKTWNGSSWSLVGSGSLNNDTNTGWAFRPSLVADPATGSLYLGWVEQQNLGQTAQTYVRKYSNGSWTILGGSLNADTLLGSAERVSVAVVGGQPFAVWGEVKYGSLRQIYAKQWNGASWTAQPRTSTTSASCDLNSDGTVNVIDVQLAVNQAIGIAPCTSADLDQKGTCNVIDVQRVINAASGKPCVSGL
jgi:hypothetical protein